MNKVQRVDAEEFAKYLSGFTEAVTRMGATLEALYETPAVVLPAARDMASLGKQVWRLENLLKRMKRVVTNTNPARHQLSPEEKRARRIARARALLKAEGVL